MISNINSTIEQIDNGFIATTSKGDTLFYKTLAQYLDAHITPIVCYEDDVLCGSDNCHNRMRVNFSFEYINDDDVVESPDLLTGPPPLAKQ